MKPEEFIETLKNIIDTEEQFTLETKLSEILEWDSVSMVAFFSFCGVKLQESDCLMERIEKARTVGELYNIIGEK